MGFTVSGKRTWLETLGFTLGALGVLLACKGDVKAEVQCQGAESSVNCEVKHVAGSDGANVCWDLHFTCANGTVVTGHACQDVDPQATAQRAIPITELTNYDKCDKAQSFQVKNIKLKRL